MCQDVIIMLNHANMYNTDFVIFVQIKICNFSLFSNHPRKVSQPNTIIIIPKEWYLVIRHNSFFCCIIQQCWEYQPSAVICCLSLLPVICSHHNYRTLFQRNDHKVSVIRTCCGIFFPTLQIDVSSLLIACLNDNLSNCLYSQHIQTSSMICG